MTHALITRSPVVAHRPQATPARVAAPTRDRLLARHHASIAEIDRTDWNRLFPGHAEDYDYFLAAERAGSAHFTFSAVAAYDGHRLVAAAPVFRLDYRLDTTLPERLKALGRVVERFAPRLARVPVLGLGSPMSEECPIGIDPALDPTRRMAALEALIAALEQHAKASGISILALKDVTDADATWCAAPLAAAGFARMASLPVATLPLPYDTFESYLKSLPSKRRTEIRSKLKQAAGIETEIHHDIDDIHDEILALYRATRANRKASYEAFDEVPDGYFREVMRNAGGKARVLICRHQGRIVSFNFFLVEKDRVIGKFVGMDYRVARQLNLYFFNWMTIVRFCVDNGIAELQTGQTTYAVKVRLGCRMKRSWIHFKHRGRVMGWVFRRIAPVLSLADADTDLAALGNKVVYMEPTA